MESLNIFQEIIKGNIPCVKLYEDDICIAILDKFPNPNSIGQSLIIPKQAPDYAFDLEDSVYSHCLLVAKNIAKATDKALNTHRTCLVVEGFEVPHAHIKLYPTKEAKLDISGGESVDDAELGELAEKIKKFL